MDLQGLESLIATIRAGSFTGAARVLGVPKSTVANRVVRLEARLGTRLLERTTRQVRPTEEGTTLFRRGERLLLEARDLEQSFHEQNGSLRGMLRVSVPALFEQEFMGTIASAYLAQYPDVKIEIVPVDRSVDLVGEGFDCAIRIGPLADSTAIAKVFAQARNIVVAAPSLVDRLGLPQALDDFARWPVLWLGPDQADARSWEFVETGRTISVTVRPRAFLGSLLAARAAVLEGAGAAFLPDIYVSRDIESGQLACISSRWQGPPVPFSIIYPAHKQSSPRLRAFVDIVVGRFGKC